MNYFVISSIVRIFEDVVRFVLNNTTNAYVYLKLYKIYVVQCVINDNIKRGRFDIPELGKEK